MYTYQYAVGHLRTYQPGYHIVDISAIPVSKLLKYFTLLDIVLYDETYKRQVRITLDDYASKFSTNTQTISQFLTANGNNTLTYYLDIPKNEYVYAIWESPYHKGFYVHPANKSLANDRQEKLTAEAAPDIRLIRDNYTYTSYKTLSDYALFIMNGCFVRAEGDANGLYLRNAGRDYIEKKQDVYISAINFEKIGKITSIPITKDMIRYDADSMGNKYFIDLDKNVNFEKKTVWVVFNGQLLVNDDIIGRVNSNTLYLNMGYVDIMKHHVTYSQYTRTPTWVDQDKRSQYITNALSADNSFIILIDNPGVGIALEPLVRFAYPLNHQTNKTFSHPVMLENGLFPYCYRRSYGIKERIINTDIGHLYLPVIDSVGRLSDNLVYTGVNKGEVGSLPRGYLFKITAIAQ